MAHADLPRHAWLKLPAGAATARAVEGADRGVRARQRFAPPVQRLYALGVQVNGLSRLVDQSISRFSV